MKIANLENRPVIVRGDSSVIDAGSLLGEEFADFSHLYRNWEAFVRLVEAADLDAAPLRHFDRADLGSPSPSPRQIIAVGLNYSEHAAESGFTVPDILPPVFTKFVSSLTGPDTEVVLPAGGHTDWEAELVVVIGTGGRGIAEKEAWDHAAGLALGQDISERVSQLQGPVPQFALGKSFAGFTPVGPWLVTLDEIDDPDDISLGCAIDGVTVQEGSSRDLLFSVPRLISKISDVVELYPGDIIFTGTPAGVGQGRTPQRFLAAGEELTTWAKGIGRLHQRFVASPSVVTQL